MKNKVITPSKNAAHRRSARGGPPALATPLIKITLQKVFHFKPLYLSKILVALLKSGHRPR